MTTPRKGSTVYDSKDPAPAAPERTAAGLEGRLTDHTRPLFERFQALFGLRNLGGQDAIDVLGRALARDPSALLRHEVAFVFGQMADERTVPYLRDAILGDPHPMVRHEAVEALGNFPQADTEALLKQVLAEDQDQEVHDSAELALANLAYLRDPQTL